MLHLTLELRISTPSQDQVLPTLAPALDHVVVLILVLSRNHCRIQEEARGRVVTITLGQGHVVITVQGQGHPHTEDTIHGQGLQYLEASLPLNVQLNKEIEKIFLSLPKTADLQGNTILAMDPLLKTLLLTETKPLTMMATEIILVPSVETQSVN